jgi:hypothetical protein
VVAHGLLGQREPAGDVVVVANIRAAQAALPVPLAVENVAALLGWPQDEQPPPARRAARPSDLESARAALARAQDDLVAALVTGAAEPPGFDPERVRVQADALLAKRRGLVARLLPDLAETADFPARFAAYARSSPRPSGGSVADAEAFARHHSGRWQTASRLYPSGSRTNAP